MPAFLAPLAWGVARAGVGWAARRLAQRAATAAAQQAVPAATAGAIVGGGAAINEMMDGANEDAEQSLAPADATTACADCEALDPCAQYANGVPGSPYRGGSHAGMSQPVGDGLDSHHTPADSVSPLPRAMGPAIQMDPADHRQTASYGGGPAAEAYRDAQAELIEAGQFQAAVAMDVADVTALFGDKYAGAIAQMEAYATCLERNGVVN